MATSLALTALGNTILLEVSKNNSCRLAQSAVDACETGKSTIGVNTEGCLCGQDIHLPLSFNRILSYTYFLKNTLWPMTSYRRVPI